MEVVSITDQLWYLPTYLRIRSINLQSMPMRARPCLAWQSPVCQSADPIAYEVVVQVHMCLK